MGREELRRLEDEANEEGLLPPDTEGLLATWRSQGWPGDPEPLHELLLRYEGLAELFGEAWVASPEGPVVLWPPRWGSWSFAAHRAAIRRHRQAVGETDKVAAWYRALASGGAGE